MKAEKNKAPEPECHRLGGRDFLVAGEPTIGQDLRFMALITKAGIDEITMGPNEDPESFARRVLSLTIESGTILDLLSCILIPKEITINDRDPGEVWTPEIGAATAEFLAGLKSRRDKAKFRSLVISLLIYFFENGIASLMTSKTSFQGAIPTAERENNAAD